MFLSHRKLNLRIRERFVFIIANLPLRTSVGFQFCPGRASPALYVPPALRFSPQARGFRVILRVLELKNCDKAENYMVMQQPVLRFLPDGSHVVDVNITLSRTLKVMQLVRRDEALVGMGLEASVSTTKSDDFSRTHVTHLQVT